MNNFNLRSSAPFSMVAALLFFATSSMAEDIDVQTRLSAATVYPQSATVTRSGQVSLVPGEHQLIFHGLPAGLDPALVRISMANNGVRLGSVDVEQVHERDLIAEEERQLNAEIQALKDQRRAQEDTKEAANLQLQALSEMASGGSKVFENENVSVSDLGSIVDAIGGRAAAARATVLEADIAIRELDEALRQKERELQQIATRARQTSRVTVQVRTENQADTDLVLTYPVYNARWHWLYEARLDTQSGVLEMFRQAEVSQISGEPWERIALTLSTAQPRRNAETPELPPLFVDVFDQAAADRAVQQEAAAPRQSARFASDSAAFDAATVTATQYLAEYEIPGRVSLPSADQQKVLPVDSRRIDAELVARVVPEVDNNAYLEARFTYEQSVPMQAGRVQLYRDGAFVGRRYLEDLLPGAEVRFPFGIDDRIQVAVEQEPEESGEEGILGRTEREERRVRYEVSNYHDDTTTIEVVGRIPSSRDKTIEVDIPNTATPATERDLDGKSGVLLWTLEVAPGETESVRHYYDLTFPQGTEIRYR